MNDMTTIDTTTATEVTTAPKTLAERLVAAKAVVAKLEREIAAEAIKNDIRVDDVVVFSFGRGDKKRDLEGKVIATKVEEEGTMKGLNLRVIVGEGFDAETFKVHVRDLVANKTQDERNSSADTEAPAVGGDPLNND